MNYTTNPIPKVVGTYGEIVHSKAIQGRPFSISHDCFQRIELGNVIHSPLSSTPMMI